MRLNRDALSESSSKRWRADLSDKFSAARMLGKGRGRESPLWKKFNAEWGWVVGNSWPILAERGGCTQVIQMLQARELLP